MNYNLVHIYPIFIEMIFIFEAKALNINYAQINSSPWLINGMFMCLLNY